MITIFIVNVSQLFFNSLRYTHVPYSRRIFERHTFISSALYVPSLILVILELLTRAPNILWLYRKNGKRYVDRVCLPQNDELCLGIACSESIQQSAGSLSSTLFRLFRRVTRLNRVFSRLVISVSPAAHSTMDGRVSRRMSRVREKSSLTFILHASEISKPVRKLQDLDLLRAFSFSRPTRA